MVNQVVKSNQIIKDNTETTKRLCKQDESDQLNIKSIDFFKTSFWGEPIPPSKIDRVIS